jgi:hypothetical protein
MSIFGVSIKGQVMKVINQKIKDAQKAHDLEVKELNVQHTVGKLAILDEAHEKMFHLNEYHKIQKEQVAIKHVKNIIGNLI